MDTSLSFGEERDRYADELGATDLGKSETFIRRRMERLQSISNIVHTNVWAGLQVRGVVETPDIIDRHALGHRLLLPSILRKHLDQLLCLQGEEQVTLGDLARDEISMRAYHEDPVLRLAMLRQLHRMDLLKFPKSWCWKVDRTAEEYDERFGFSTIAALQAFAEMDDENEPRVLLEWGSGNGNFKAEVEAALGSSYRSFAINDAIYFPPQTLARRIIDIDLLARDIGAGEDFDADAFAEFVTLVTLQQPDTYDTDVPLQDEAVTADFDGDVAAFVHHLKLKAALLPDVDCIRDPAGAMRDGGVVYPHRKLKSQTPYLAEACAAFAQNPVRYLNVADVPTLLSRTPAHITGVLPASFEHAYGKLASRSVNASLAVRSTEYVPPELYIDFQTDIARVITEKGIVFDDSVRRNYGKGNRIVELREVEGRVGFPLWVILGPGQEGEDRQGELVPQAFVMTRDERKIDHLLSNLLPGFVMLPLSEIPA